MRMRMRVSLSPKTKVHVADLVPLLLAFAEAHVWRSLGQIDRFATP
jgi:hypothetical protein